MYNSLVNKKERVAPIFLVLGGCVAESGASAGHGQGTLEAVELAGDMGRRQEIDAHLFHIVQ